MKVKYDDIGSENKIKWQHFKASSGGASNGSTGSLSNDLNEVDLRGDVDDISRALKLIGVSNEHSARPDFLELASLGVFLVILGIPVLELQGNAAAHDADAVHRIDEGVCRRLKNVATCGLDHGSCPPTQ
jgi:hypothetical protein